MLRVRVSLMIAALACGIGGTVAICQVRSAPEQFRTDERMSDRINSLSTKVDEMKDYNSRLIRLEDGVKVHSDQLTEITWWARGIGFALILGVMERVFKIAVPKNGPVG